MCFGSSTQSTTQTNSNGTSAQQGTQAANANYTPNANVSSGATQNLNYVKNLQDLGYTPYTGERVAPFSGTQNQGFDFVGNVVTPQGTDWTNAYGNAPAQNIGYNTIASAMGPYMSQYVDAALMPQLRLQAQAFDAQNKANDAQATGSGAFGDPRAAILKAQTQEAQDAQRQGLISNAYNTAFNTAIGAGAQDVANKQSVGTTNANFNETALGRGLQALNSQEGLAQFLQQIGAIQQQQQQAKLNVPYSDYLAQMQYPFLTSQLLNQVVGTGAQAMPAAVNTTGASNVTGQTTGNQTSTTTQPNNSGWGILGSLGGALLGNSGLGSALGAAIIA